jgi:endonuclease/exonuclease/phosphatase (EEP) superfamily protein YafD
MIAATAIPLVRADAWWVRVFDFPRLQIALVLILTFSIYVLVREDPSVADHVFLALLTVAVVYQAYRMYPYTPLCRKQVQASKDAEAERTFSLLISNVQMTNRTADVLRRLIDQHDPDIILTVETDRWWEKALADLERSHPHVVRQVQDNTYGMLLHSRLELRDVRVEFLVEDDIPSIHSFVKLQSGEDVELHCLHPRPPAPQESDRTTERDAELLIVAKHLKGKDARAIVAGDLNDVAWSRTNNLFQSISGLLDPRVGRGFFHTFNANWPFIRFPLDHVFSSRHFRLVAFKRLPHCGSDHFPVFVKLALEPDAKHKQEHPQATPEEKQEAEEKIEKAETS